MNSRVRDADTKILELKGQVEELNKQLLQRDKSQEDELARREQQVYYNTLLAIYPYKCALVNYSTSTTRNTCKQVFLCMIYMYQMQEIQEKLDEQMAAGVEARNGLEQQVASYEENLKATKTILHQKEK